MEDRARDGLAFAVLGDWNRRLSLGGDAFLADLDDGDPDESRLTLASGDRAATCKARYREFIDHIVTGPRATARVEAGSFEEYVYGGASEDSHPSDHCPVSVRISG